MAGLYQPLAAFFRYPQQTFTASKLIFKLNSLKQTLEKESGVCAIVVQIQD